jgi:hypothetical protein
MTSNHIASRACHPSVNLGSGGTAGRIECCGNAVWRSRKWYALINVKWLSESASIVSGSYGLSGKARKRGFYRQRYVLQGMNRTNSRVSKKAPLDLRGCLPGTESSYYWTR